MTRRLKVRGVGPTIQRLASLHGADFYRVVAATTLGAANQTRTTAIKSIQAQSIGKTVLRQRQGGGMRQHVASKPGDPPNTDTGALVRSIAVERAGRTGARVGTGIPYGEYLERGTTNKNGGVLMAARPWLAPADEKTDIEAIAKTMLENFLRSRLKIKGPIK